MSSDSAVDRVFQQHIAEIESKAKESYGRQKWMMFGYWKAVAIHLRKIHRMVRSDIAYIHAGFPTRFDRPIIERQSETIRQLTRSLEACQKEILDLFNQKNALAYDLGKARKALSLAEAELAAGKELLERTT
jgi:hypothetical protein